LSDALSLFLLHSRSADGEQIHPIENIALDSTARFFKPLRGLADLIGVNNSR